MNMSGHDHHMHHMTNTTTMDPHMNHNMVTTTMNHMDMGGGGTGGHNHGGAGMNMNMTDSDRTCMGDMLMFFHTGKCEYVLFETLRTKDVGGLVGACFAIFALGVIYEGLKVFSIVGLVGACFAIFALGVIYEGLKVFREHLLQKAMITANKYAVGNGSSSQDAIVINNKGVGINMMSGSHFVQTVLHMVQVFISYCLMLVFMTYNVYLCLSVIVGAGVGYFLFGWRKAIVVDINEHCH